MSANQKAVRHGRLDPSQPRGIFWYIDGPSEKQCQEEVTLDPGDGMRDDLPSVVQVGDQVWLTSGVVDIESGNGSSGGRDTLAADAPQDQLVVIHDQIRSDGAGELTVSPAEDSGMLGGAL